MKPTINSHPDPKDAQFLEERLYEYNVEATGIGDGQLLTIFLRDESGEIKAGLYGTTWGGTGEVRSLWVRRDCRREGLGHMLLQAAEEEARARGCTQMVLNTHSFQAPNFYKKYGYEVAGVYENYPLGHQLIFLRKAL